MCKYKYAYIHTTMHLTQMKLVKPVLVWKTGSFAEMQRERVLKVFIYTSEYDMIYISKATLSKDRGSSTITK